MIPSVKEPLAGLALLVILGFLIWYNRPIENSPLFDPYLQGQTPRFAGEMLMKLGYGRTLSVSIPLDQASGQRMGSGSARGKIR